MKVIAEIGNAHDGSLGQAHAMIEAAALAGANAVKMQCHVADAESTPAEQFRPGTYFPQDATRQDYWRRMEFTHQQWRGLSQRARDLGLEFGASVFSDTAFARCGGLVDFWKVPAGGWSDHELLHELRLTREPIYWSLGHCGDAVVIPADLRSRTTPLWAVNEYPSKPERISLGLVGRVHNVGLSDHSGEIWPGLIAAWRGAPALEVHVCFHRGQFGPDTPASLTFEQLAELVRGVRWINRMGLYPPTAADRRAAYIQWKRGRRCG